MHTRGPSDFKDTNVLGVRLVLSKCVCVETGAGFIKAIC